MPVNINKIYINNRLTNHSGYFIIKRREVWVTYVYLDSSPVNLRFLAEGILDSKLMSDNYTLDIGRE